MKVFALAFARLLAVLLVGALTYLMLQAGKGSIDRAREAAGCARTENERLAEVARRLDAVQPTTETIHSAAGELPEHTALTMLPYRSETMPTALTTAAFSANVVRFQRISVQRRPSLVIDGSPLRSQFLARLGAWRATHDLRLKESDWPEILARECEANP